MSFHLTLCFLFLRVFTSTLYSLLSILIVIFFFCLHFLFCFCRKQIHCSCNGSVACLARHFVALFLLLLHDCKLRLLSINHATIIYGVLMCVVCAAACIYATVAYLPFPNVLDSLLFLSIALCLKIIFQFSIFRFEIPISCTTHVFVSLCWLPCSVVVAVAVAVACAVASISLFSLSIFIASFLLFSIFFLLCTHSMRFFVLHAF